MYATIVLVLCVLTTKQNVCSQYISMIHRNVINAVQFVFTHILNENYLLHCVQVIDQLIREAKQQHLVCQVCEVTSKPYRSVGAVVEKL